MVQSLNRVAWFFSWHKLAKNWRSSWNSCRTCCTWLVSQQKIESQRFTSSTTICVDAGTTFASQIRKRIIHTLPGDFGEQLPSLKQIEHFLTSRKLTFERGHTSLIGNCPLCASKAQSIEEKGNARTLYINKTTGSHFCKNCGLSGTWSQFKKIHEGNISQEANKFSSNGNHVESSSDLARQVWEKSTSLAQCDHEIWEKFINHFSVKELRRDVLEKFQVRFVEHEFKEQNGRSRKYECILFPWYDVSKETVRGVKLVRLGSDSSDSCIAIEPRQGFLGLFGWNTVDSEKKEVVLTSNEFDAIAVSQSTMYPAISLPMGTNSLPLEVLPQLEQFEKIVLWFGNDVFSRHAANQFSKKLNLKRCFLVRPNDDNSPANALDALNLGYDLTSLISAAQPISHEKITTFHQLRSEVFDQFVNAEQVAGVKWKRFPKLNNILKGLRRGEVTVFTGPTGAGKTTLLSEMSLDLCMQGVNTLWGSFEIRNVRLVKMMMCQYSGLNLERNVEQFHYWADKFEMLPMYFMCFYGAQNINTVIETMSHAAYVYDIEHVIVDNLQFMTSYLSRGDDRFSAQNHVISALRNFASTRNVHVTLVIHPRKENDDVELQTASIFGTAKASQEADNVVILQSKKGAANKYLQVTKNRFDGVLGRVPLDFVRESLSMSGFGKTFSSMNTRDRNGRLPEKLNATRVTADVNIVKFSAPRIIGAQRSAQQNGVSPKTVSSTPAKENKDVVASDEVTRNVNYISKINGESNHNETVMESDNTSDKISEEKKESVKKAVKKILSGTRLYTKAVNGPRNSTSVGKSSWRRVVTQSSE